MSHDVEDVIFELAGIPIDVIDPACAWCCPGGPGDANGSHRICARHAAALDAEIDALDAGLQGQEEPAHDLHLRPHRPLPR